MRVGYSLGRQVGELGHATLAHATDDTVLLGDALCHVARRPVTSPLVGVDVGNEEQSDPAAQVHTEPTRVEPGSNEPSIERLHDPFPVRDVGLCLIVLVDVPGDDVPSQVVPEPDHPLLFASDGVLQVGGELFDTRPSHLKRLEGCDLFGHDDSSLQVRRSMRRSSVVLGLPFYSKSQGYKKG